MLTSRILRRDGFGYYVSPDQVALSEEPGQWLGSGAARLGLHGTVDQESLGELFAGRDPWTYRALRRDVGTSAVAAIDLTFSAPKSVSILSELAPQELAGAARMAHMVGTADALAYLELQGLAVRRSRAGVSASLPAQGPVAARFVHHASRTLDPHLHSHVLLINVGQGPDGLWSSVDTRRLLWHRSAAQAIYHASLRHELSTTAGVRWLVDERGFGRVDGVDPGICHIFSRRTTEVDEAAQRQHRASRPGLFRALRPAKETRDELGVLRTRWRRRAMDELGTSALDLSDVIGVRRRSRDGLVAVGDLRLDPARWTAVERVPGREREAIVAVAGAATQGARLHDLLAVAAPEREMDPLRCPTPGREINDRDPGDRTRGRGR